MDKQLLKAYIRTIVEDEVQRLVPKIIKEHIKSTEDSRLVNEATAAPTKPRPSKNDLASMLGITRDGDTIRASTGGLASTPQINIPDTAPDYLKNALTKDYSAMLKTIDKVQQNKNG